MSLIQICHLIDQLLIESMNSLEILIDTRQFFICCRLVLGKIFAVLLGCFVYDCRNLFGRLVQLNLLQKKFETFVLVLLTSSQCGIALRTHNRASLTVTFSMLNLFFIAFVKSAIFAVKYAWGCLYQARGFMRFVIIVFVWQRAICACEFKTVVHLQDLFGWGFQIDLLTAVFNGTYSIVLFYDRFDKKAAKYCVTIILILQWVTRQHST